MDSQSFLQICWSEDLPQKRNASRKAFEGQDNMEQTQVPGDNMGLGISCRANLKLACLMLVRFGAELRCRGSLLVCDFASIDLRSISPLWLRRKIVSPLCHPSSVWLLRNLGDAIAITLCVHRPAGALFHGFGFQDNG
jgi:hypothetical protein